MYAGILTLAMVVPVSVARADDGNQGGNGNGKTLVVDDDKVQCPTAQYTDIEDAVQAAPAGATIHVCPGLYKKQVVITKPVRIKADTGSILQPPTAVANGSNLVTAVPIVALVLVSNTNHVRIDDLTVDGVFATQGSCTPLLTGITWQNASGTLSNMAVRNIRQGSGLEGCQSGLAIFVQSGNGGSSNVTVSGSSIHDYQKGGIVGNENGTTLTASRNVVTGDGANPNNAQNGVQIAHGATGEIEDNLIADHLYSPCVSLTNCSAVATNVVIFNSSGVSIHGNVTNTAQVGIYVQGDNNAVRSNSVSDNRVFDGIELVGNNDSAQGNTIFHSDQSGVYVQGNGEVVKDNVINEAAIGVLKNSGSTAAISDNTFFNVPVPVQDPPVSQAVVSVIR